MTRGLILALLILPLVGCSTPVRPDGQTASDAVSYPTPMRFRRLRKMLDQAQIDAHRGNMAAVRARGPAISNEGLALIKATMPHDVARADVPRYLEGRARFGEALKRWVGAVESGTDAQLVDALREVDDAARGWVDGYLGREPETSV